MPPAPRSEQRLAAAVFFAAALLGLGASAFLAGIVAESRSPEPGDPEPPAAAPPAYREDGPALLVCTDDAEDFAERNDDADLRRVENERLYEDCLASGHRDLASAIAAAAPGDRILVLPGRYPTASTITVDGLTGLQIEGLGNTPDDVLVTADFNADTVFAAREADGLHLSGIAFGQARATGLQLTATTGATLDNVAATHSGGDGIRIADSSAVALTGCRADTADTAGIALQNVDGLVSGCDASGNLVGLLASGGDTLELDGNRLHGNTTGLAITGTAPGHEVRATANLVYGNNTDHYARLGTRACDADPADRDWAQTLCPGRTFPSGVGILVADGTGVEVAGNRLWNQQTAAIAAWGTAGLDGSGDRNRFEDNAFGVREDGQRQRNRLDLWWDGVGAGNCFAEPGSFRTLPASLPDCDGANTPSRLVGDPLRAFKVGHCGIGDTAAGVPEGCDWFGARFTDRLEFQAAVVFAAGLLFLTGAGWLAAARAEHPPRAGRMTFSALATGSGGLLLVLAVWSGRADYEALAVGLWGVGWLLAGRSWRQCGMVFFGLFTSLIGAAAVLDAVDRAVWTIPFVPVSPAWFWLALLPLWTLIALGMAFGPRRREEEPPPVERTPVTAPSHDRFDW
ncbi:right-handed parallel beta-helix repeat-containing protein [Glycomyces sp. NPDC048151]|uniref:right-handed parallel beta-helix repeat-containing protein n=1 Tax=Glycomyces sp. NPDC048151 TaxID=3364002 RepID=UPI0037231D9B